MKDKETEPLDESEFVPGPAPAPSNEEPPARYERWVTSDRWGHKVTDRPRWGQNPSAAGLVAMAGGILLFLMIIDGGGGLGRPFLIAWLWGPLLGALVVGVMAYIWRVRSR